MVLLLDVYRYRTLVAVCEKIQTLFTMAKYSSNEQGVRLGAHTLFIE